MTTGAAPSRVTSMLISPDVGLTAHAVALHRPTTENPGGYHRLIGGGVERGETHRAAVVREVREELGATIANLVFLARVESTFRMDGAPAHEIVFVYSGRLQPEPARVGAALTESDGTVVPVVWRPFDDRRERLPLYPAAVPLVQRIGARKR